MLATSRAEIAARQARATELMLAQGLDALLLTNEANVHYFSGYRPFMPWASTTRPFFCLAPAGREALLLVHDVWSGGARADSPLRDIRTFSEIDGLPAPLLSETFRAQGLAQGRVGVELGAEQRLGLSYQDFETLQAALPGVAWVDASSLIWELRLIKSAAEIARLRQACHATEAAFAAVFPELRPGMTQRELELRFRAAIPAAGADFGFIAPTFGSASYTAICRDTPLQPGALIWVDLGAVYGGYWSDFSRAATIGPAGDAQRALWQQIHQVTQAGVALVRPGRPIAEIVAACQREAQQLDLEMNFAAGRIGHGIGLMLTEPPHIAAFNPEPLRPGMVFTLEPGIVTPDGMYVVEQNLVVTATGYELLTPGRWQIWEG